MAEGVLAIEASQRAASVAFRGGPGGAVHEVAVPAPDDAHDHLMASIDAAVRAAGCGPGDIGLLAVSVGPGGFTGLRVACATAKAVAEVTGCRLVAVPSALSAARAAVRAGALPDGPCTVVLAAKGGDAWCAELEVRAGMPSERSAGLRSALGPEGGPVLADDHLPVAWADAAHRRGLLRLQWSAAACLEVGEALAESEGPCDPLRLLPIYPRQAEAVTLWEARHGVGNRPGGRTG
jgi:tRNA threonylcarbamoyladenosine biosynthesis protein TsaB